jgi:NAD(P)H-hydrate epimerase
MQRAGAAVAQFCLTHFKFGSVCVVCGKGNGGGVGMVAAEAIRAVAGTIAVIILAKEASDLSQDTAEMFSRVNLQPVWISDAAGFDSDIAREALASDLIIDAVCGMDFAQPFTGLSERAVEAINDAFGTVVSVDLPSGVDSDITRPAHEMNTGMVFAHGIVSFIAPRAAHIFGELTSGPIAVNEIGVQPVLVASQTGLSAITGQEVGIAFPPRPQDANKGQFGHVLVVAGSLDKAGAAGLAGIAALRAGAGLVTVACPRSIQPTIAGFAPELMTVPLSETSAGTVASGAGDEIIELMKGKDAVVLGPGLSDNLETAEFIRRLVARCDLPLVLNADGLNAFADHPAELSRSEAAPFRVLISYPEEAARLLGVSIDQIQEERLESARRMARETNCCVVLKGWRTVVAGLSGETWINMTGNAALAKGGSGDVLSGIIAAALGRRIGQPTSTAPEAKATVPESSLADSGIALTSGKNLQETSMRIATFFRDTSVAAAVYLHGLAGDFARDLLQENCVLASDVLNSLAQAFRECELQAARGMFYLQK